MRKGQRFERHFIGKGGRRRGARVIVLREGVDSVSIRREQFLDARGQWQIDPEPSEETWNRTRFLAEFSPVSDEMVTQPAKPVTRQRVVTAAREPSPVEQIHASTLRGAEVRVSLTAGRRFERQHTGLNGQRRGARVIVLKIDADTVSVRREQFLDGEGQWRTDLNPSDETWNRSRFVAEFSPVSGEMVDEATKPAFEQGIVTIAHEPMPARRVHGSRNPAAEAGASPTTGQRFERPMENAHHSADREVIRRGGIAGSQIPHRRFETEWSRPFAPRDETQRDTEIKAATAHKRTRLRDAIAGFRAGRLSLSPSAPSHTTQELARSREAFTGAPTKPTPDRLLETRQQLQRIAAAGGLGMEALSNRHLRFAPWVLLAPDESGQVSSLIADPNLLAAYLGELSGRAQGSAIAALIHCLLLYYPQHLPIFTTLLGSVRSNLLQRGAGARLRRWRECMPTCELLAPDAATRFARRLLTDARSFDDLLGECNLRGMLSSGAFVKVAFGVALTLMRAAMTDGRDDADALDRLFELARAEGYPHALRFEEQRVDLIEGLLLPFADGQPSTDSAGRVKRFLLDVAGDPRMSSGGRWQGVAERARRVMLGWLVTETLEVFFRLLEYAAKTDQTAHRHWEARREFLTRYLRAGVIQDAWVALGRHAREDAAHFLPNATLGFGHLHGATREHSAIVLRIGDLTITEWTHNAKLRIWLQGNGKAPSLHDSQYMKEKLMHGADEEFRHVSGWQDTVARWIYDKTGV